VRGCLTSDRPESGKLPKLRGDACAVAAGWVSDRPPTFSGGWVALCVQFQPGGHVLGDRVAPPPDGVQGGDPDRVVGLDEHGHSIAVGARWITLWNGNCWDSAALVMKLSQLA
jgi:hypothetical protein